MWVLLLVYLLVIASNQIFNKTYSAIFYFISGLIAFWFLLYDKWWNNGPSMRILEVQ